MVIAFIIAMLISGIVGYQLGKTMQLWEFQKELKSIFKKEENV